MHVQGYRRRLISGHGAKQNMKIYVIMLAGGKGSRMNASVNKVLIPVCGKTVIARSIEAFVPFAD